MRTSDEIHDQKIARWKTVAEIRIFGGTLKHVAEALGVSESRAYQISVAAKRCFQHPKYKNDPLMLLGAGWLGDGRLT
jgi:DNA-directed RNA polymerase sigma subunit (sigma70/sigma32)